jgi:GNAT superfamily N-acetyltransferase
MTAGHHTAANIRRLLPTEWPQAFPVISQLRTLDEAEFLRRVRHQSYSGYELIGAFVDGDLVGVMGVRPVHTLARGGYLHVDDLVVIEKARGYGAGHALMEYAEADARARNMSAVFLDARPEAIPFYERRDYVLHSAPSMKKVLGSVYPATSSLSRGDS